MRYRLKVDRLALFIGIDYSSCFLKRKMTTACYWWLPFGTEIMDSLGPSPGYTPSEADLVPEENMKMLEVVDMRGLGYALPTDPARPGDSQITWPGGRACELSKECQNHKMTGSSCRGMLLSGDLSSCAHHCSYSSQ